MTKPQMLQHTCSTIHKPLITCSHTAMASFSVQIEFQADNETINENKRSVFCACSATVTLRPSIKKAIDAFIAGMVDWTADDEEAVCKDPSITDSEHRHRF